MKQRRFAFQVVQSRDGQIKQKDQNDRDLIVRYCLRTSFQSCWLGRNRLISGCSAIMLRAMVSPVESESKPQ